MKTVVIIQARMGSSRLPGKVLADLAGKTMLRRVIERVAAAQSIDEIVVATTCANDDDILAEYLKSETACDVFRGPIDDVLTRFYECARLHRADIVVRVTADDPLKDPQIIEKAIQLLRRDSSLDYCSNTMEPSYPEGLDVEVVRFSALRRAYIEAQLPSEREHVTPYIWKHPDLFNVHSFRSDRDLRDWRWTVDRPEDLAFMREVYKEFSERPLVPYQEVIAWLESNPEVRQINSGIGRNEGYLKSLQAEKNEG